MSTDEDTAADTPVDRCGNCATPLAGPYCYVCGQPKKGLIRPLSGWIADFFDSVFDYDGRLWRTLGPLLFRPGFLSREYIAGRRVRYVTPVRLFLFLSIILFFAIRLVSNIDSVTQAINLTPAADDVARIERVVAWLPEPDRQAVLADALAQPQTSNEGSSSGSVVRIDGWEPGSSPIRIGWLSDGLNAQLNAAWARVSQNLQRLNENPGPFLEQLLSVAPQTLFFLLPVFALLLKLFYLFKRWLYLEHLLVALHSHSFIALALLLIIGAETLAATLAHIGWLAGALRLIEAALWCWIPINLFLTQKRVYGQGWVLTGLKFIVIGTLYLVLLVLGSLLALLITLLLW